MKFIIEIADEEVEKLLLKLLKKTSDETEKDDGLALSQYARFFDETSSKWSNDSEYNLMFLRQQEAYATVLLRRNGYLFLNDVYDMLGMPRTKEGQVVGWVYDEKNPTGDNFVNFGIYNGSKSKFVNGYEKSVLLDFNVDGNILDKIEKIGP